MAPLLLLSLLLLLDSHLMQAVGAVIGGAETGNTFVDWQRGVMVHSVAGSCYVSTVPADRGPKQEDPKRLYATDPLSTQQVAELNAALSTDCPTDDTWWLSQQRPDLPTLADYLLSYYANNTDNTEATARRRRSANDRPSNTLRRRLQDISRRMAEGTLTAAQVRESGGKVLLTNDPYPSPLFERSATDGQRFRHYKAFYDEIARNSRPQSDGSSAGGANANSQPSERNSNPGHNVLNSYSLRVRGNSRAEDRKESVGKQNQEGARNRNSASLQLQGGQQSGQYEIHGDSNVPSNNGKRHVSNSESDRRRQETLRLLHSTGQYDQQEEETDHQSLRIPDSIIKDGQVFYRHDASADLEDDDSDDEPITDFKGIDGVGGSQSLIFSQAQGSTGNDGSFRAEAEGHGRHGESTHSAVDGSPSGASASSSAIRFDQHAMAHVQVSPSSGSSQSSALTPQIVTQTPVAASEIEEMMRRNGYTGFAMATVKARKKTDHRKPLSNLGHILPGYSSASAPELTQDPIIDDIEEDENDMVDSIVEQVYNPSEHDIIIDHGGLEGGAGTPHRETEFQQINNVALPEGGVQNGDDQSVGLATYTQGVHGFPPNSEFDYQELLNNLDRYNFNQPSYFPEYDSISGADLDGVNLGQEGYSRTQDYLPTNLNTGVQFPIIQGDVSVPVPNNGNTMLVDDTLSSYFPQPQLQTGHGFPHTQQSHGDRGNENINSYNVDISERGTHSGFDPVVSRPDFQSGENYDYENPYIPPAFPSSSGVEHDSRTHLMNGYLPPDQGNFDHVDSQRGFEANKIPQLTHANDDRNHYSVQSGHGNEGDLLVSKGREITQPAYNSPWEYERSQQRDLADELGSGFPNEEYYNRLDNIESENNEPIVNLPKTDASQFTSSDGSIRRETFEDNRFDPESDYDENGYESSFETSSQSSSQSAQSVYTASHHYSFQHGSNERGIGSSTNTALVKPAIDIPDTVDPNTYYPPNEINVPSLQQRPTLPPESQPHPSSPRQQFPIQQYGVQPSASQGMEHMQVISPGGPGSMQSLPSSDASLSEVKVVMVEAPSAGDQMERIGKVIMAGEKIPGTTGYMVPPGFRGRLVLGNNVLTSMSSAFMTPGMAMQQILPSGRNGNMQVRLSSSSSASSAGSGVSLSSSASSTATGTGALSAMSESSSNGFRGRTNQNVPSQNQPVYSYQQTYNANPREHFQHPNAIVGPYFPSMSQQNNNPGMRSKSWSSWKTSSWQSSGGNGNMGSQDRNPGSNGQYVSQSSAMPDASDCGYWSMSCRMVQSPFQSSEICRPTHVILPCCC